MKKLLAGTLATMLLAHVYQQLLFSKIEEPQKVYPTPEELCKEGVVIRAPDDTCTYCIDGEWITLKCKADEDPVPPFRKAPDPEPYEEVACNTIIRIEE